MVHLRSGSDYKAPVVEPQVELEEKQAETHLVTGGGGYPGYRLAKALQEKGHNVVIFDIRAPTELLAKGIKFVKVGGNLYWISNSNKYWYKTWYGFIPVYFLWVTQGLFNIFINTSRRHFYHMHILEIWNTFVWCKEIIW